jgi:hypothetical protein
VKWAIPKRTLVAAASLLALIFIALAMLVGLASSVRSLDERVLAAEAEVRRLETIKARKDEIEREYRSRGGFSEIEGLSDKEIYVRFLREVEKISKECGLVVVNLNPQTDVESGSEKKKYLADLRAEAELTSAISFLSGVQNSAYPLKIERLSFSPKNEDASVLKLETVLSISIP